MNGLRELAAADLKSIVEDADAGFGWPITVTDPDNRTADMVGFSTDVFQTIDPDTGLAVSGRTASVALVLSSLKTECLGTPRAIADSSKQPWVITFEDILGEERTFKVSEGIPDLALGIVVCQLEVYAP